jgi:hypothetical protein
MIVGCMDAEMTVLKCRGQEQWTRPVLLSTRNRCTRLYGIGTSRYEQ